MPSNKNETNIKYKIHKKNDKTKETKITVKEDKVQEMMEELVTEGKGRTVDVLASQTYTFHTVSETDPITDFLQFVPSDDKQANLINRSVVLKQQQFVRRQLMQKDFTPVEGAVDLFPIISQKSESKSATLQEKASNGL